MNEDIQEGVVPQTIDYDNLDLPDPDAKQEDEQPESEEEQQIDVVNEETQEEVTEDVTHSSETDETATEESSGVEEIKETTNEVVEQAEISQEPNALFDVGAKTEGVIQDIDQLKEVSRVLSDPFFKKMYDYYKDTGDIKPFLQANSIDYSKMSGRNITAQTSRRL